ncbi:Bifunctional inhibitor/plant lipid transfer protein/seed storage helical domain [Dillenia turbinata]|uniref:Bifunctional inhibitor/plant lipid transfer protein/seed storage helical domain n=1 Tax=Dillenia turbinata TaxID=194707 RepID=A0AAN8W7C1_9MAGN
MGVKKGISMVVMVVVVLMVLSWWEVSAEAPTAAECKQERNIAIKVCMPVIYGKMPSPQCCERARVTHIECVCPVVTPELAALIDVNKAVRLIEGCGRTVPRHYTCGSITTP